MFGIVLKALCLLIISYIILYLAIDIYYRRGYGVCELHFRVANINCYSRMEYNKLRHARVA